jgi:2-amino-4-hydroxy-6-hydroxymethyldihydropteridine diphosphokinase
MNAAFLILGGNVGDRAAILQEAEFLLEENEIIVKQTSSVYETAAWGMENASEFLNKVVEVETKLDPHELLECCLNVEKRLGRTRTSVTYESRTIDIDILFFNTEVIQSPSLTIPHPRMHSRRFALLPMMEINADYQHPSLQKTIKELVNICTDTTEVRKFSLEKKTST